MTPRRAATLIVMLLIPGVLWGYLNHVKNDVLMSTRFVIKKVQLAETKGDERSPARFFIRYRLPVGDPDRQERLFQELWSVFRDLRPTRVRYGNTERLVTEDGRARNHRQVIVEGKDLSGEAMTFSLDWVQYRGSWYIQDYQQKGDL
jgi:hypothetical protein